MIKQEHLNLGTVLPLDGAGFGTVLETHYSSRRNLETYYIALLRKLGEQKDMLGQIFTKAQNKNTDPAKLYRLIDMVGGTDWGFLRQM